MKGGAVVCKIADLGLSALCLPFTKCREPVFGSAADAPGGRGRLADGAQGRRDVADQLEVGLAGCAQAAGLDVERDDLRLLAEAGAEAEAEVERDADDERDVGLLQPLAAGAGEAELVVGRQAAPAHAVEEDGDAERLGEGAELLLPARPVEPG